MPVIFYFLERALAVWPSTETVTSVCNWNRSYNSPLLPFFVLNNSRNSLIVWLPWKTPHWAVKGSGWNHWRIYCPRISPLFTSVAKASFIPFSLAAIGLPAYPRRAVSSSLQKAWDGTISWEPTEIIELAIINESTPWYRSNLLVPGEPRNIYECLIKSYLA